MLVPKCLSLKHSFQMRQATGNQEKDDACSGRPKPTAVDLGRDSLHRQPCHSVKDVASLASACGVTLLYLLFDTTLTIARKLYSLRATIESLDPKQVRCNGMMRHNEHFLLRIVLMDGLAKLLRPDLSIFLPLSL